MKKPTQNSTKLFLLLTIFTNLLITLPGCAVLVLGAATTGALAIHDRRQASVIVDDERIEVKANDLLYNDKILGKKIHVNITSYNHVVLLTGETVSDALKARAVEIVSKIEKIKRVHNEIHVANLATFKKRSNDTWLTSKVKTAMLTTKDFDANRIKVVTENNNVYLMGLVTDMEGQRAAEIASKVANVKRVVTFFEYISEPTKPKAVAT